MDDLPEFVYARDISDTEGHPHFTYSDDPYGLSTFGVDEYLVGVYRLDRVMRVRKKLVLEDIE